MFNLNDDTNLRIFNLLTLAGVRGSFCDYFIDNNIKRVSVFSIYEYGVYIVKLLEDAGIIVEQKLSLNEQIFYWDKSNENVIFKSYVNMTPLTSPLLILCNGKHFPWRNFKFNSQPFWFGENMYAYSLCCQTIIKSIKRIKQTKNIKAIICRLPNTWDITREPSVVERAINVKAPQIFSQDWIYEKCFSGSGMTKDEFELCAKDYKFNSVIRDGICRAEDVRSLMCNVVNGYRVTENVPDSFENGVFMFGNSALFGFHLKDSDTIASYLQRFLNARCGKEWGGVYNCANRGGNNLLEMAARAEAEKIRDGDVLIFTGHAISPLLADYYDKELFEYIDLIPIFQRPHNYGELFFQPQHYTPKGCEIIADKICEVMLNIKEITAEHGEPEYITISHRNSLTETENKELISFCEALKRYRKKIGAIVMNCNPFTLGHRYLIETAAAQVEQLFVFVVEEDASFFKFTDRLAMVNAGTIDLHNVTVLPSGKFIISQRTFEAYSKKSEFQDKTIDASADVDIFCKNIAPALGVTVRFAGEEPLDNVTRQYNDAMRRTLPEYGIDFVVIPRKEQGGEVISASRVRKALERNDWAQIADIVPTTTLAYLKKLFYKRNVL